MPEPSKPAHSNTPPEHPWPKKFNWATSPVRCPPKRRPAERICEFDEIYGLYDEATARTGEPLRQLPRLALCSQ